MSSSLSGLSGKPAVVAALGVAAGAFVTLAATHLTNAWCPVAQGLCQKKRNCPASGQCPMSSSSSSSTAATSSSSAAPLKAPMVVTVTGAAGQIGYAILFQIAQGRMLGMDQPVELRLLEITPALGLLGGVVMELEDCAFPLVTRVVATDNNEAAFSGCDIALLIGARPRSQGMDRSDLLKANAAIFKAQGAALNQYAKKSVKILVVGNPANTNAKIAMEFAPTIPKTQFTAMTRLDEFRAYSQVSLKTGVSINNIKNIVVWGNHSNTQFPDVTYAKINQKPAAEVINDAQWVNNTFITKVQKRGGLIIETMKKSSAASAANAAIEHVRSWVLGTEPGQWVSMAVCSNGEYGITPGIIFSFPCICKNGKYEIVKDLQLSEFAMKKLQTSEKELLEENSEWQAAFASAEAK